MPRSEIVALEMVLTHHLSRDPAEHRTDTLNATVAHELAGRGVTLNPGESVRYVITESQADMPSDERNLQVVRYFIRRVL